VPRLTPSEAEAVGISIELLTDSYDSVVAAYMRNGLLEHLPALRDRGAHTSFLMVAQRISEIGSRKHLALVFDF
jgi:hypothetical protein